MICSSTEPRADAYAHDAHFPPRPIRLSRLPLLRADPAYRTVADAIAHAPATLAFYATMSARHAVLGMYLAQIGRFSLHGLRPSDILRKTLQDSAAGIVLLHNHPSGNPEPEDEDEPATEQLVLSANLIGIAVFDHVIVTRDDYFSFYDAGLL